MFEFIGGLNGDDYCPGPPIKAASGLNRNRQNERD